MRHLNSKKKLGRSKAHREALLANLASSLIIHKRIKTTHVRAQELRRYIEPLITFAKRGDLHARRQVLSFVLMLFESLAHPYCVILTAYFYPILKTLSTHHPS